MGTGLAGVGRRRWPWVVAAMVVLAVAVAGWARYAFVPGYRPALAAGERFGVDVSNHQGDIDWPAVAADDMRFAYIKATEGGDYVDTRFTANWAGARAAGLDRGAYHFFTLCRPGAEQAENFLRTVPADADALPPVVDLELGGNCAARPDRAAVETEVRAFVDRVEDAGRGPVVLYLLDDMAELYPLADTFDRSRWERRILRRPARDGWWIWQVTGFSRVAGIGGPADLDVMSGPAPQRTLAR
jgi:lysozyme